MTCVMIAESWHVEESVFLRMRVIISTNENVRKPAMSAQMSLHQSSAVTDTPITTAKAWLTKDTVKKWVLWLDLDVRKHAICVMARQKLIIVPTCLARKCAPIRPAKSRRKITWQAIAGRRQECAVPALLSSFVAMLKRTKNGATSWQPSANARRG